MPSAIAARPRTALHLVLAAVAIAPSLPLPLWLTAQAFAQPGHSEAPRAAGPHAATHKEGVDAAKLGNPGFLEQYAQTRGFSLGLPQIVGILPKGDAVLFLRATGPKSFVKDLWMFDVAKGQERVLLTAEQVLEGKKEELTAEELARRERARESGRGIVSVSVAKDGRTLLVPLSGRLFVVDISNLAKPAIREIKSDAGPAEVPKLSRDGKLLGVVRQGALFVADVATGAEKRISPEAKEHIEYGLAEFVAQEEMDRRDGFWFSPDGSMVVYQRTDTSKVEKLTILDPSKPGEAPQTWPYPRAGQTNAEVTLSIAPTQGGDSKPIVWDRAKYPYVARVNWPGVDAGGSTKNGVLTILVQNRLQNDQLLLSVDPATGTTRQLIRQRDAKWLDIASPMWLKDGSGFFWTSDEEAAKTGLFTRTELRNPDGSLKAVMLDGSVDAVIVGRFADDKSVLVQTSKGVLSSTLTRLWLDGSKAPEMIASPKEGTFVSLAMADEGTTVVRTLTRPDGTSSWTVHKGIEGVGDVEAGASGGAASAATTVIPPLGEIKSVATPLPSASVPKPEWTTVTVDGAELHASIIRPKNFQPGRKYPVLNHVYGGPTHRQVSGRVRAYTLDQWLADEGFIIVSVDARGTPGRGYTFEHATHGDVISIPLAEQANAMIELCNKYPEMNRDQIGIFGWSFGGYFTSMATMRRPDVFKAGCAGGSVADWRDYDTHYTERYMGLPQDRADAYTKASVLTYAKDLRVPLLLIHGTSDDNVYFFHTLKIADALFRAGKKYELLPLSGFTHSVYEPTAVKAMWSRIVGFFQENLRDGK